MNTPFLTSERIYFRSININDADSAYLQWVNDSDIRSYMGTLHFPSTKDQLKDYIQNTTGNPSNVFFAIMDNATHKHIGNIKLGPIDWINRKAGHGFLIGDKSCWGKGYGSEALNLLLRYAFLELNLNKVNASMSEDNQASFRVHEKVGFVVEGKRRHDKFEQGLYKDIILVGITRDEFLENHKS